MEFYIYHFKRKLWFLFVAAIWLAVIYGRLYSSSNMLPVLLMHSYLWHFEVFLLIPAYVLSILTLSNGAETEFCTCYGVSLMRLSVAQGLPYLLITIPALAVLIFMPPVDTIVLEPSFCGMMLVTGIINLFSCTTLARLVRKAVNNLYGSIGIGIVLFYSLVMVGAKSNYTRFQILFSLYTEELSIYEFWINRGIFLTLGVLFLTFEHFLAKKIQAQLTNKSKG